MDGGCLQVLTNDDTPPGSGPLRVVNVTEDTVLRLAPSIADGGDAIVYFPLFSSGDVQPWPAKVGLADDALWCSLQSSACTLLLVSVGFMQGRKRCHTKQLQLCPIAPCLQ